jgi:serine/threonine protein kinase
MTKSSKSSARGKGEVYRARDTKLPPEVAIKVLPEHLTKDPERRKLDYPSVPA